jgi:hypothetical protein
MKVEKYLWQITYSFHSNKRELLPINFNTKLQIPQIKKAIPNMNSFLNKTMLRLLV